MLDVLKTQATRLNKDVPLPLYYQIKQQLKEAIEAQVLKPDEALPSERELIDLYGVSRPTVRQATEELMNEGYLYRKRGLGTFIAGPKLKQELPSVLGFTERMSRQGRVPTSRIISKGRLGSPGENVLERLALKPNDKVYQIKRLRLADNEPIQFETTNLPLEYFPKLAEIDLTNLSLYQFLRDEYGLSVTRLRETLEPVVLGDYESKLLEVTKGSPAMLVQISAFAADGRAIEYSQALVRGDRCQYYLELDTSQNRTGPTARVVHNHVDLIYNSNS